MIVSKFNKNNTDLNILESRFIWRKITYSSVLFSEKIIKINVKLKLTVFL